MALFPWLARGVGVPAAAAASAAAFALSHLAYDLVLLATVCVLGCVFAWARHRTGGLLAPILLHASWNAVHGVAALAGLID